MPDNNMTAIGHYFIFFKKIGIFTKKYLTKSCKNARIIRNTEGFIPRIF